ncbi:MAG: class I mannose-6-phosphate isomerase [Anaerolineae bacterium]|jgi:mannose-6-phosphate isomerase
MPDHEELYPLKLAAIAKEKVWGGHKLARTYRPDLPADRPIGELWVVWGELTVENGVFRGQSLDDLLRSHPQELLGSRVAARQPHIFPLLVKLLDAQARLSVQVHPGDTYAQSHEGEPYGKAEAWYILAAEPGARLIHGVARPVSRAEVKAALEAGTLQSLLESVEVSAGEVFLNVPGTIHAIQAGIMLYELQQSSDLTYRFYDWDRLDPDRPLHIEESLDVADLEPFDTHTIDPIEVAEPGGTRTYLCAYRHFAAELLSVQSTLLERPAGECFHILTALQGAGGVHYRAGDEFSLTCGESLLVPAAIPEYELRATGDPLVAIKAYVPDLQQDIVAPLQAQGISNVRISQLGGLPRHSDLTAYLE